MRLLRADAEGGEDWIAEGDLVPEKSGAGDLEADLDSNLLEAADLDDLGVEGAAIVLAAAGWSSSAIFFPAML